MNLAQEQQHKDKVFQIFTKIAKKYERFNAWSSFGTYKLWLKTMVDLTPADSTSNVIDIAGGTGDVSFTLAKAKHPNHIQLTDFVPAMLNVARQHYANGKGCGVKIDFEQVDAQDIPHPDNSFDIATMAYGIRNIPNREQALSQIYRILKPGGTLVCLEFSTPTFSLLKVTYSWYLQHIIPMWGKIITGDKDGFVYLGNSIKEFPNQEQLAEMFMQAGFKDVWWKNQSFGIAAIHIGKKPDDDC